MPSAERGRHGRWIVWTTALALAATLAVSAVVIARVLATLPDIPSWATWTDSIASYDLDGDGQVETVVLADRRLEIHGHAGTGAEDDEGPSTLTTDADWLVSDCLVGDIDHEGTPELVMLVWAPGSYGSSRPFWAEEDTDDYREHVYLFRYEEGRLRPLWMSSALELEAATESLDARGRLHLTSPDGSKTCWAWESWGLTLVDADDAEEGHHALALLAVGYNITHRGVLEAARGEDGVYDFPSLYADIAPLVGSHDLAAVTEEAPLLEDVRQGTLVSGAPYTLGDALAGAGFDIILNATNHVGDFGAGALADELAFWHERHPDVLALGIHEEVDDARYEIVSREGVTLALFDYTQSTGRGSTLTGEEADLVDQLADEDRLVADLANLEDEVDFSVCFLHAGPEGQSLPDEEQRDLCERLVGAGADLIVCSHTHTMMPFRRITTEGGRTGVVFYGLGDFVSTSQGATSVLGAAASVILRVDERDGQRVATIGVAGLVPLVCHTDEEGCRVCRLGTYEGDDASELMGAWLEAASR